MRYGSLFLLWILLLGGCTVARQPVDPFAGIREPSGQVVWQKEYAFRPPPAPWSFLTLGEEDYSVAFFHACGPQGPGQFPCESTFAYDEEPFGYSRDLRKRQEEFFRRFLWAARIDFDPPVLHEGTALGGRALIADTIGHERVQNHKALVRAVFAHRGQRVVAFYFTQWRPKGEDFDRDQLKIFQDFVDSFEFRRPSFYQRLEEGLNDRD